MKRRLLFLLLIVACSDPVTPNPPPDVRAWLDSAAAPLASLEPGTSTTDLAPLGALAGDARLIGFGEDTHGTHEFFTMKNRAFQYLVQNKGVTGFAIEATMPVAFALDTYVRTGAGDPAKLLAHLYFWTWNTQEVLDLITWLRQYDIDHPAAQVGFYGFDMQFPGIAIDSVLHFGARVSSAVHDSLAAEYACLIPFRNDSTGRFGSSLYQNAPAQTQQRCGPDVAAAYAFLLAGKNAYSAATSARDYELALRLARVVQQWEQVSRGLLTRDAAMAENASWLLDREGAGGKLFLWAHNFHISRVPGSMGTALNAQWHADYRPIGFAFGSGGFHAVEALSNGQFGGLKVFLSAPPRAGSYEETLVARTHPHLLLDLRSATGGAKAWLGGPHPMRSIGAVYTTSSDAQYYFATQLPDQFDRLIFVRSTLASEILTFVF
jgi:erythromycin esterase